MHISPLYCNKTGFMNLILTCINQKHTVKVNREINCNVVFIIAWNLLLFLQCIALEISQEYTSCLGHEFSSYSGTLLLYFASFKEHELLKR